MNKYEPIRASEIKIEQLDRIEKKMDRILELLEGKELSISLDGKKIADSVMVEINKKQMNRKAIHRRFQ